MFSRPDSVTNLVSQSQSAGAQANLPCDGESVNTEAELVERCRNGNRDAWDALFDKYYATVARFVFQLSAEFSHEDTEEICQETFLALVRS